MHHGELAEKRRTVVSKHTNAVVLKGHILGKSSYNTGRKVLHWLELLSVLRRHVLPCDNT